MIVTAPENPPAPRKPDVTRLFAEMSEAIRIAQGRPRFGTTPVPSVVERRDAVFRQHALLRAHRVAVLDRSAYLLAWVASLTVPIDHHNDKIERGLHRQVDRLIELVANVVAYAKRARWGEAETHYWEAEKIAVNLDNWGRLYWSEAHQAAESAARRRGHAAQQEWGAVVAELYVQEALRLRQLAPDLKLSNIVTRLERRPPPPPGWHQDDVKRAEAESDQKKPPWWRTRRAIDGYLRDAGLT